MAYTCRASASKILKFWRQKKRCTNLKDVDEKDKADLKKTRTYQMILRWIRWRPQVNDGGKDSKQQPTGVRSTNTLSSLWQVSLRRKIRWQSVTNFTVSSCFGDWSTNETDWTLKRQSSNDTWRKHVLFCELEWFCCYFLWEGKIFHFTWILSVPSLTCFC